MLSAGKKPLHGGDRAAWMKGSHDYPRKHRSRSAQSSALRSVCFSHSRMSRQRPLLHPESTSTLWLRAKSGPPVADLQQQDFTLFDNKAPKHITSFQAVTGKPGPRPRHPGDRCREHRISETSPTSADRSTSFCVPTAAVWPSRWHSHSSPIRERRSNKISPPTATSSANLSINTRSACATSAGLRSTRASSAFSFP